MKPKILKLLDKIDYIKSELLEYPEKPYGGGNPYYYCSACDASMIDVSIRGHNENCMVEKLEHKLKSVQGMVNKELEKFVINEEYDSKSFKHYCWFKKDLYVKNLNTLNNLISEYQRKANER